MYKGKIKFEPSFYLVTLLAILMGYFNQYMVFAISILLHECGHLMMALFFGWELEELKFFAFGGKMQFKGELNKSNKEDLLISSAGIMTNGLLFIILVILSKFEMNPTALKQINTFMWPQLFIIGYNLTPLPPLDGSRIFGNLLYCFLPYRTCLKVLYYFNLSLIAILSFVTLFFNFRQFYLVNSFLLYSTLRFNRESQYLFHRFLLHKKMYRNVDLPIKISVINNQSWEDKIYRGYLNVFNLNERLHDELKWLQLKFRENKDVIIDVRIKSE